MTILKFPPHILYADLLIKAEQENIVKKEVAQGRNPNWEQIANLVLKHVALEMGPIWIEERRQGNFNNRSLVV